jgi:FAD/FMN-containing dehydrogenase
VSQASEPGARVRQTRRTVTVQPGVVLDHLNAILKPHGCGIRSTSRRARRRRSAA